MSLVDGLRERREYHAADEIEELREERDVLAERVEKLERELRDHAVGYRYADQAAILRNEPIGGYCMLCETGWDGLSDDHAPDCVLTRPSTPPTGVAI